MLRQTFRAAPDPHSDSDGAAVDDRDPRHTAAVRRTLKWADEAARAGDYKAALEWLAVIEAIGDELPPRYQLKREVWGASAPPQSRCEEAAA